MRDIGVTGVQTCALPISALGARGGPAGARFPERGQGALPHPAAPRGARGEGREGAAAHPGRGPALDGVARRGEPPRTHKGGCRREIGRASGRDRVVISVVAGSLKKKKYSSS